MLTLDVNGAMTTVDAAADTPLLYALRGHLGLVGPRFGCGLAQCGACTVLVDGRPTRSCVTPAAAAAGKPIRTLEGLATPAGPHPVQQAFIDEQAAQCGYCLNGMILAATALLAARPDPSDVEIREALAGYLCRCGVHLRIIRAVKRAARALKSTG